MKYAMLTAAILSAPLMVSANENLDFVSYQWQPQKLSGGVVTVGVASNYANMIMGMRNGSDYSIHEGGLPYNANFFFLMMNNKLCTENQGKLPQYFDDEDYYFNDMYFKMKSKCVYNETDGTFSLYGEQTILPAKYKMMRIWMGDYLEITFRSPHLDREVTRFSTIDYDKALEYIEKFL